MDIIHSGFYSYTWWAQLAPIEKQGEGGSFDNFVGQNFLPIFTGQTTLSTKLSSYFFCFPLFFNLQT